MKKYNLQKRIDTLHLLYDIEELENIFKHIEKCFNAIHRLEGGQPEDFAKFFESERVRTDNFSNQKILANEKLGYGCIYVLALLNHPCQECAEDDKAWHTRAGFCQHLKK